MDALNEDEKRDLKSVFTDSYLSSQSYYSTQDKYTSLIALPGTIEYEIRQRAWRTEKLLNLSSLMNLSLSTSMLKTLVYKSLLFSKQ